MSLTMVAAGCIEKAAKPWQLMEKCIQTNLEGLDHAARQCPKTNCQHNKGLHWGERVEETSRDF